MVDDPKTKKYYGAEVSAPIFANMASQVAQVLNLTPNEPVPAPPAPTLTSSADTKTQWTP
jgi:hypothetical protein